MTAALTDITWALGSFVFNSVDTNGVMWAVDVAGTKGWYDEPDVRTNQTPMPRYDGAYDSASFRSAKVITIPGWAQAPNKAAAQQARDAFVGMYPLGSSPLTLTVTDGTQVRTMSVKLVGANAVPFPGGAGFVWQLVLTAVDPRKYGTPGTVQTGLPASSGVGLDWGTGGSTGLDWGTGGSTGLDWGTVGSNGAISLANIGTAESWPTFTITGPITNPSITDGLGNVLAYTQPVLAGQTLTITTSPYNRSVMLGTADVRAYLTTAQWAAIPANSNMNYQFQGSSAGSPLLTATFAPAYW